MDQKIIKMYNIKENRKFQILICIIIGLLMVWSRFYIETTWKKLDQEWENLDRKIEKINDSIDDGINI